jgi:hypothetical protein
MHLAIFNRAVVDQGRLASLLAFDTANAYIKMGLRRI